MLTTIAFLLLLAGVNSLIPTQPPRAQNRSFIIGYNDNCFLKDGECFRYVSGSMHYFRVPREYWKDRMLKIRAAGINALQTYIEWSSHEPEPGVFDFTGNLDLVEYIKLAAEMDLLVILRPGPFIDSERDMGGLPYWLLRMNKKMALRTLDPTYMVYVERYLSKLLPLLKPLTYAQGGPIISVQVENEYGSYFACDHDYTARLRYVLEKALGPDVLLFTTDGNADYFMTCGQIDGAYTTVDFGSGQNATAAFAAQRKREPRGPLVNSEYYPGWIDHWSYPHSLVSGAQVAESLDEMLAINASVNIYLIHGGTSFGYKSGANYDGKNIMFCPTSYDFDAPISEAGDLTTKFLQVRDVIGKYLPLPPGPLPQNSTKISFGPVHLRRIQNIFRGLDMVPPVVNKDPLTFEELQLSQGFVLYEATVEFLTTDPVLLNISGVRDRGYIFVDRVFKGILSRGENIYSMPLQIQPGQNLSILVENQGRICYGSEINDFKGIVGNVLLGSESVLNWSMWTLPIFQDRYGIHPSLDVIDKGNRETDSDTTFPAFYSGNFTLPAGVEPADTFLSLDGWFKGVVSLNGFTLGRYWPIVGPQSTLYVPGVLLKASPEINTISLFELEGAPCPASGSGCNVNFVDTPEINRKTPLSVSQLPMHNSENKTAIIINK